MLSLALNANVRRTAANAYGSGTSLADINPRGDLMAALALPERSELVRLGNSYAAQVPAASAWTALITIPTTLANLSLQNGSSQSSGIYYLIDRFWIKAVTSTASAGVVTPLAQLVAPGTALVADNAAVLRWSLNGKTTTGTGAQLVMASTATGCVVDKWMHFSSAIQSMTTNIASCMEVLCYGRYLVPPQGSFNINAQESVSGGTLLAGVEWHEVVLVNG